MYILNPAGRRPKSPSVHRSRSPGRKHGGGHHRGGTASSGARSGSTQADIAALTKTVQKLADITTTAVAASVTAPKSAAGRQQQRAIGAPSGSSASRDGNIISLAPINEEMVEVPVSSLRLLANSLGQVREHVEKLTVLLPVIQHAENAMRSLSK